MRDQVKSIGIFCFLMEASFGLLLSIKRIDLIDVNQRALTIGRGRLSLLPQMKNKFSIERQIHFYETDLMGIVHHGNYLRLFEEARVAWAIQRGFLNAEQPGSAAHFAVLETWVKHLRPLKFGQNVRVELQVSRNSAVFEFQYRLYNSSQRDPELSAVAITKHAALNSDLRPIKMPKELKERIDGEESKLWTETWLSNL